jgi:hypothetical protein
MSHSHVSSQKREFKLLFATIDHQLKKSSLTLIGRFQNRESLGFGSF